MAFTHFQVGGDARGARVSVVPEVKRMISHHIRMGDLNDGDTVWIKFAEDGLSITRKEVATAATITISNKERALSIGTISLTMTNENYEVVSDLPFLSLLCLEIALSLCLSVCLSVSKKKMFFFCVLSCFCIYAQPFCT